MTCRIWLALLLVASTATQARADLAVSVENGNARGMVDHFEAFDVVCSQPLSMLTLGGQTSGTINICGGLGQVGDIRIRYDGESEWTDYPELHGWSVITLPERPRNRKPPKKSDDDD